MCHAYTRGCFAAATSVLRGWGGKLTFTCLAYTCRCFAAATSVLRGWILTFMCLACTRGCFAAATSVLRGWVGWGGKLTFTCLACTRGCWAAATSVVRGWVGAKIPNLGFGSRSSFQVSKASTCLAMCAADPEEPGLRELFLREGSTSPRWTHPGLHPKAWEWVWAMSDCSHCPRVIQDCQLTFKHFSTLKQWCNDAATEGNSWTSWQWIWLGQGCRSFDDSNGQWPFWAMAEGSSKGLRCSFTCCLSKGWAYAVEEEAYAQAWSQKHLGDRRCPMLP